MVPVDSLLNLLVQQGGTELALASGRAPRMFRNDAELALTIPATSTEQIRELLGDLWAAHENVPLEGHTLSLTYESAELGVFNVELARCDNSGLAVRFRRKASAARQGTEFAAGVPRAEPAAETTRGTVEDTRQLPAELVALLARAVSQGASDVHLSPQRKPIIRVNTVLQVLESGVGFDSAVLLDNPSHAEQIRSGTSVDRALDVPGVGRIRINVYASDEGLCSAIRILQTEVPDLSELHLPRQLESLTELPHGLVLVCGPTGSGKTTTLAALVQHALHTRPQVLVTLEDPIEYVIRPMRPTGLVRQREVGRHVRDFATGLRDALREDPDLLLIGEMRDPATISLALTAAETGHLVFASLHTRTAPSAVERIVDTYPPERQRQIRVQLADALRAVIAQRLIPTANGDSRVPAVELLRVTHGVANLIREGRTAQIVSALQAGGNEGMQPLERSLVELVRTNRIRREAAIAAANDVSTMNEYLRSAGC